MIQEGCEVKEMSKRARRTSNIRRIIVVAGIVIVFFTAYTYNTHSLLLTVSTNSSACYDAPDNPLFSDIMMKSSSAENTIFFLDVSCKGALDSRQACSIESAARANPAWRVLVFTTGPFSETFLKSKLFSKLDLIDNLQFIRLWASKFTRGTIVESLLEDIINTSLFPMDHASDALRLLLLYKFGGVYLDMDVIVVKSFDSLPKNFVARSNELNTGKFVIAASNEGIGKFFTGRALSDIVDNYHPEYWPNDAGDVILRTLEKICRTKVAANMSAAHCVGNTIDRIEVFDPKYFCPVNYPDWSYYYESGTYGTPDAYTHHLWNKLARDTRVRNNSWYANLANESCPSVFELYGNEFGN